MLRVHEAPCSAKNRNDMFSKYVLFKKGHLNKRAGVWTPWTPPGSATAARSVDAILETIPVLSELCCFFASRFRP